METPLYRKDYPKKKEEKKVVIRNSIDNINSARDTLLNSEADDINNDIIENLEKKNNDENIIYRLNVYIQENDWINSFFFINSIIFSLIFLLVLFFSMNSSRSLIPFNLKLKVLVLISFKDKLSVIS